MTPFVAASLLFTSSILLSTTAHGGNDALKLSHSVDSPIPPRERRKKRRRQTSTKESSSDHVLDDPLNHSNRPSPTPPISLSKSQPPNECLRRIQREWKDAVRTGIAYDWISSRTVGSNGETYLRLGPRKSLLRWHFSVAGPVGSSYEGGIYHGVVLLPKEYPGLAPRIQMLTPSGRFVPGESICLSASNYHQETWTPRWTVRSLVDALRLHMLTAANEIGGVEAGEEERREWARRSRRWCLAGVVDHEKMAKDGLFPVGSEEEVKVEGNGVDNSGSSTKSHGLLNTGSESPSYVPHVRRVKRGKARKHKSSDGEDALGRELVEVISMKRVIVEMFKLPLRILSILLIMLTKVATVMKDILDSL